MNSVIVKHTTTAAQRNASLDVQSACLSQRKRMKEELITI